MKEEPNYPKINKLLIKKLKEDYPNELPKKEISNYELGFLIGQQSIIEKLDFEYQQQRD